MTESVTARPVVSSPPVSPVEGLDLVAIEADAAEWATFLRGEPRFGGESIVALRNRLCADAALLVKRVRAVEALIAHARKISPSPSMHVYVADLERALGIDAPVPHKLGSES